MQQGSNSLVMTPCTTPQPCCRAWGRYTDVVRTGTNKFAEQNGGLDAWAYLRAKPKHEENFSQAMRNIDSLGMSA